MKTLTAYESLFSRVIPFRRELTPLLGFSPGKEGEDYRNEDSLLERVSHEVVVMRESLHAHIQSETNYSLKDCTLEECLEGLQGLLCLGFNFYGVSPLPFTSRALKPLTVSPRGKGSPIGVVGGVFGICFGNFKGLLLEGEIPKPPMIEPIPEHFPDPINLLKSRAKKKSSRVFLQAFVSHLGGAAPHLFSSVFYS